MQGSYTMCFLVGGEGSCPSWRFLISSSTSLLGLQYFFLVCSIICAFFGESAWDVVDVIVSIRYSPVGNLTRAWPLLSWTSSLAISFARSLYVCRGPSTCSYFPLSTMIGFLASSLQRRSSHVTTDVILPNSVDARHRTPSSTNSLE